MSLMLTIIFDIIATTYVDRAKRFGTAVRRLVPDQARKELEKISSDNKDYPVGTVYEKFKTPLYSNKIVEYIYTTSSGDKRIVKGVIVGAKKTENGILPRIATEKGIYMMPNNVEGFAVYEDFEAAQKVRQNSGLLEAISIEKYKWLGKHGAIAFQQADALKIILKASAC